MPFNGFFLSLQCQIKAYHVMKKTVFTLFIGALLLSSCGTYTGQGAYAGATFGSILGSAIGGISGGWRGSDIGTVVGMAGGAVIGAAVGAAADQQRAEDMEQYRRDRAARRASRTDGGYDNRERQTDDGMCGSDSGFDATNSGDDRIDFDAPGPSDSRRGHGDYSAAQPRTYTPTADNVEPGYHVKYNSLIEIRNARVVDADRDGIIRRGEECKITFEIMNRSSNVIYDVQPTVFDITGNKHLHISPNLHVESIAPHSGVRYTATILADNRLKDGEAVIRVAVAQGNHEITSQVKEFTLQTRKK